MNLDTHPFGRLLAGLKRPLRALRPARIGQTLMMAQHLRGVRTTKTADILCRGDDQRRRTAQRPGHVGLRQRFAAAVAYRQVKSLAGQGYQPVGHLQLQLQLRVLVQKWRNRRYQLLTGKGDRRRDP